MVDNFALAVSHAVLALALWRLVRRVDLDSELPETADEDDSPIPPKGRLRA